ncbi:hypothetical protein SPBR_06814 [Sporothrix brasiliensis 5110]|uniref:Zn(2)-C6 fungal-type domain-containing protein n=1 Tax=Sporothrix brasiliensis 5110 TaxID=1398154 RepID=A0A0C2ETD2_9PEZI|nr:uncharacterized protein SPBR_06814 [Sporothrix brasiliensis 5110]KIH89714.1 hypothetical protein SPBR_06814 [Sporothrix brasiliensis 5110]
MNTGGGGRQRHKNQHQHLPSHGSTGSIGGTAVPFPPQFDPGPASASLPTTTASTPTPTPTPTRANTVGSAVSASSTSTTAGSVPGQRKERGAIAAQACDTCRSRKQKCDEQRPECGTCQKFKLACRYREPQPTKKDKTLGEILDRLKALEGKIDGLGGGGAARQASAGHAAPALLGLPPQPPVPPVPSVPPVSPYTSTTAAASAAAAPTTPSTYRYSPAVYQMLGWPVVQQMLAPLAPQLAILQIHVQALGAEHDAQAVVLGLHHPQQRLPTNDSMGGGVGHAMGGVPGVPGVPGMGVGGMTAAPNSFYPAMPASVASPMPFSLGASLGSTMATTSLGGPPLLSWDTLYRLSTAYFDSFNYIAPIVDRQTFLGVTLPVALELGQDATNPADKTSSAGTNDQANAALVLLVAALGDVAIAGVQGAPVLGATGGVKGGTVRHPPGLALFNEARRRMGFVSGDCSLENMQIYALAGKPSELASTRADLIRHIFWYCLIIETHFNIELGLPLTGLDRFEDLVGLPSFNGPYAQDDYLANQASHFQEHFASQIVLRRLCVDFDRTLRFGK